MAVPRGPNEEAGRGERELGCEAWTAARAEERDSTWAAKDEDWDSSRATQNRREEGQEAEELGTRRDQTEHQRRMESPQERGVPRAEIETKRKKKTGVRREQRRNIGISQAVTQGPQHNETSEERNVDVIGAGRREKD